MRVVAGELRGRRLESPRGGATRPTTDKVREAVFNALGSLGAVEGTEVFDLFAGTGALGIEALSRGATRCTFVESDRAALAVLGRNIAALGLAARATVVAGDALAAPGLVSAGLVLADPPYGFSRWADLLGRAGDALVVCESDGPIAVPAGWESLRSRRYGGTQVEFLRRADPPGGTVGAS